MSKKSNEFKNLMAEIKATYDDNELSIYVPSAQRELKFKPLSLKQQKDIINKLTDLTHASLDFNIVVDQIIEDNLIEKDHTIYVTDKPSILLSLRANFATSNLKYREDAETYEIDLKEHIEKFSEIPGLTYSTQIDDDDITIIMVVPSIQDDRKYNKFLKNRIPRSDDKNDLYQIIGDMYVYEVVKFVDVVIIRPGQENELKVTMDDLTNEQRLEVCQAFRITTAEKMLDFVQSVRNWEDRFTEHVTDGKKLNITMSSAIFATD